MQRHILPKPPRKTFCHWRDCNEVFDWFEQLQLHMQSAHIPPSYLSDLCFWKNCDHMNSDRAALLRHTESHHKFAPRRNLCVCGTTHIDSITLAGMHVGSCAAAKKAGLDWEETKRRIMAGETFEGKGVRNKRKRAGNKVVSTPPPPLGKSSEPTNSPVVTPPSSSPDANPSYMPLKKRVRTQLLPVVAGVATSAPVRRYNARRQILAREVDAAQAAPQNYQAFRPARQLAMLMRSDSAPPKNPFVLKPTTRITRPDSFFDTLTIPAHLRWMVYRDDYYWKPKASKPEGQVGNPWWTTEDSGLLDDDDDGCGEWAYGRKRGYKDIKNPIPLEEQAEMAKRIAMSITAMEEGEMPAVKAGGGYNGWLPRSLVFLRS